MLHQLGILITRPIHQAHNLAEMVRVEGGIAWLLPCIVIEPPQNNQPIQQFAAEYLAYDALIFTSANAVNACCDTLLQHATDDKKSKTKQLPQIFAIGPATANALLALGLSATIAGIFNSEGLLAHPLLQNCSGKKIALLAGESGRDLLLQTLLARGAAAAKIPCYRRAPINADPAPILDAWQQGNIHIVTSTSAESLTALKNFLGLRGLDYLFNTPLVVLSERLRELANPALWPHGIWVAEQACDADLLTAIIRCAQEIRGSYNSSSSAK